MFKENNDKMYHVNAYYDAIDVFITIYNFFEMALSSMIYKINDVIMCSNIIKFPVIYILT